jgi:hypothetical protein
VWIKRLQQGRPKTHASAIRLTCSAVPIAPLAS